MLYTSTLILLGRLEDPADLPEESVVSAITLAERSAGPHVARTAGSRHPYARPAGNRPLLLMMR